LIGNTAALVGSEQLHIVSTNNPAQYIDAFGTNPSIFFRGALGTVASPTAVGAGNAIGNIAVNGWNGSAYQTANPSSITFDARETFSSTAAGCSISFLTTALTTLIKTEAMRIQPSGGVSIGASAVGTDPGTGNLAVQGSVSIDGVTISGTPSAGQAIVASSSSVAGWASMPTGYTGYTGPTGYTGYTGYTGPAGSSSTPNIRGTGIQASSASSFTVSWPTGTVAGDLAIIFTCGGYTATTPANWTSIDYVSQSDWTKNVFWKVLNSTDITNGSVTVSYNGTYDACTAIITLKGAYNIKYPITSQINQSGSSSITLNTTSNASQVAFTTNLAIYFCANRANSVDTIADPYATLTQQKTVSQGNASGTLYTGAPAGGNLNPTFSYATAGTLGNYQIVMVMSSS
jgi:hypothetical protein